MRRINSSSLLLSFLLLSGFVHAEEPCTKEECGIGVQTMRLGARHIEGNGIGYDKGYSTLELFLGKKWNHALPFVDLRGHIFNNGKYAANAGLGYRDVFCDRIYGINAYYDYKQTHRRNYKQVGLGLETMGTRWDFRINGYWPVGSKSSKLYNPCFDSFCGNTLFIRNRQQISMKGVHAEAGAHLGKLVHKVKLLEPIDFYTAIGPYYFVGKNKNAYGGQFRLEGRYQEYVRVEFNTSYDNIFKDIYQGQVGLYLPFGPKPKVMRKSCCKNSCADVVLVNERMAQPVIRDEIIVNTTRHKVICANDCNRCDPLFFWFVDNASPVSKGTFERPFATLGEAQNAAQPGDFIYVFSGTTFPTGMDTGIVLKDNQSLLGAATRQFITTGCGDICIPAFSCVLPALTNSGPVVTLANNNTVSGFNIKRVNGSGVTNLSPITNATITNNVFTANSSPANAIDLTNVSGTLTIACNDFGGSSSTGNPLINITASNIQDAQYLILNNKGFGFRNQGLFATGVIPVFRLTASNTQNLYTKVCGNDFSGGSNTMAFNYSNDTNSVLNISNNEIISDSNGTGINISQNASTNSMITLEKNTLLAGTSFSFGSANNSSTYLALDGNELNNNDSITANNSQLSFYIANNIIKTSQLNEVAIILSGTSQASGTITHNTFTGSFGTDLRATISANSTANLIISENSFNSGINGISIINSGTTSATISNNQFIDQGVSGLVLSSITGQSKWNVTGNTFKGAVTAATVSQTGTGSTCLSLTQNSAIPTEVDSTPGGGAYQLVRTNGTFNLEPLVGNIGRVSRTGTINNVPIGTCQ